MGYFDTFFGMDNGFFVLVDLRKEGTDLHMGFAFIF